MPTCRPSVHFQRRTSADDERLNADAMAALLVCHLTQLDECNLMSAQYNLSVESNQNVESKRQTVESKMRK